MPVHGNLYVNMPQSLCAHCLFVCSLMYGKVGGIVMAACKVSKKGSQHVSSEAQQCECENRCIHCFKLQNELKEV